MAPKFPNEPETARVEVLRAFVGPERKVLKAGWKGELDYRFAREMHASNKVRFLAGDDEEPKATKGKKAIDPADGQ